MEGVAPLRAQRVWSALKRWVLEILPGDKVVEGEGRIQAVRSTIWLPWVSMIRNLWPFLTSNAWPWPALTMMEMGLVDAVEIDDSIWLLRDTVALDGDGRWPFVMV